MTLYEAIFARRSVRQYDPSPIDPETVNNIQSLLDTTKQIAGQSARFKIVTGKETGGNYPHAILAYCDENDAAYVNVGYVLEKADLYIQSVGLGSLWLGMAKPSEKQKDFCIMLAFGKTDVPQRTGISELNRLPIGEISSADNTIAVAARLAPSAVNSQPWKLLFEDGKVTVRYVGRGAMKLILKKRLNKIDLGIVTRHIVTALRNEGKVVNAVTPKTVGKELSVVIEYS